MKIYTKYLNKDIVETGSRENLTMKYIFLLIFIFSTRTVFLAQSANDLDTRYGFMDIKLDDSYQKWKPFLRTDFNQVDEAGNPVRVLENISKYNVFGYKINTIALVFKDDKVSQIQITLENFQVADVANEKYVKWRADDFDNIRMQFNSLFGKGELGKGDKFKCDLIALWFSNLLVLDLRYYNMGVTKYDYCTIWLTKKSFLKSKTESGF